MDQKRNKAEADFLPGHYGVVNQEGSLLGASVTDHVETLAPAPESAAVIESAASPDGQQNDVEAQTVDTQVSEAQREYHNHRGYHTIVSR